MKNKEFKKSRGGATLPAGVAAGPAQQEVGKNISVHEVDKSFGGIGCVKILRY